MKEQVRVSGLWGRDQGGDAWKENGTRQAFITAGNLDVLPLVLSFLCLVQVEERLRFYEDGVAPRKNVDVMGEALAKAKDEQGVSEGGGKSGKKEKKEKKKRDAEEVEEEAPKKKKVWWKCGLLKLNPPNTHTLGGCVVALASPLD